MPSLRLMDEPDGAPHRRISNDDASDWLTLPQAACELGVSVSTVRRLLRKGQLRNRLVSRRGGFTYLVYFPDSRHAGGRGHLCTGHEAHTEPADKTDDVRLLEIKRLEGQVEDLSRALTRALRTQQPGVPIDAAGGSYSLERPYARYRWLVRRRRWWPF